ncbi:hypothetical protein [Flavivirga spongiicola]|uniref:Uncharacterized protein n=1 Tax=Flavivirga spongiicola TaxID=421621 RepID=A0ABU7XQJ3_9FLAO|nr:hypothetical protein [Flavivirga sp. MEBiC05379]MDO5978054.1 hypothetical protein [Flavivirga sp. MEBiC05379]
MKKKLNITKLFFAIVIPLFLFQNCSNNDTESIIEDNSKLLEVLAEWGLTKMIFKTKELTI